MIKTFFSVAMAGLCLSTQAGDWKLVWSDEFDGAGLPDVAKWNYETGFVRNNELQFYTTGRKENARVEGGMLILEAVKERFKNPDFAPGNQSSSRRSREFADYTSASITTRGKFAWQYGRIEARAKLPQGRGLWPAIWMLGERRPGVGWPACGEIDIMEYVGHEPGVIHGTIHTAKYNHVKKTQKGATVKADDPSQQFHRYAVEWDEKEMSFFVDDRKYFTFENESTGEEAWPFDKKFYLILNVAVGGSWGGQKGVDEGVFPQRMTVDYVRVYERAK